MTTKQSHLPRNVRDTSMHAYYEIIEDVDALNEIYCLILKMIRKMGSLTDREIARYLLMADPNKVRPRRNELADPAHFDYPLVTEDGQRKCMVTNRVAYTWKLTPEGEKVVDKLMSGKSIRSGV
jgi:hypothetical protein